MAFPTTHWPQLQYMQHMQPEMLPYFGQGYNPHNAFYMDNQQQHLTFPEDGSQQPDPNIDHQGYPQASQHHNSSMEANRAGAPDIPAAHRIIVLEDPESRSHTEQTHSLTADILSILQICPHMLSKRQVYHLCRRPNSDTSKNREPVQTAP
jgi:hypothetical protein